MTYRGFGEEDLAPVVKYGSERPDLDYKGPVNWDEWHDRDKASLVRSSAFPFCDALLKTGIEFQGVLHYRWHNAVP